MCQVKIDHNLPKLTNIRPKETCTIGSKETYVCGKETYIHQKVD